MSVEEAARVLGIGVVTLRRALERHARRDPNGVEAVFDGVRARKLGRLWRVTVEPCWGAAAS